MIFATKMLYILHRKIERKVLAQPRYDIDPYAIFAACFCMHLFTKSTQMILNPLCHADKVS